jgi:Zn-dependent protease
MVAHEYAHGYAALKQGDPTARDLGRLTLNPLKHIDPFLTVLLPAAVFFMSGGRVIFGGAKPVPVNPANYREPNRGDLIVSSAGIVMNLALFVACLLAVMVVGALAAVAPGGQTVLAGLQRMLLWGVWLNLLLAFFNLIPVPPLDGSHLLYHLLPAGWQRPYRRFARYGVLVLMAVILIAPQTLWIMLTPAFLLQGMACELAAPLTLRPFPLCLL